MTRRELFLALYLPSLLIGGIADLLGLAPAAFLLAGVAVLTAATIYAFVQETLQPPAVQAR